MVIGEIRDISFRYSQKGNQMFRLSIRTESDIKDQEWVNVYLNKNTPLPLIDRWWELIGDCPTGRPGEDGTPYTWLQFATIKSFDLIGVKVKLDLIQEEGWDGWKVDTVLAVTDIPQEKITETVIAEVQKEIIHDDDIPF